MIIIVDDCVLLGRVSDATSINIGNTAIVFYQGSRGVADIVKCGHFCLGQGWGECCRCQHTSYGECMICREAPG